MDICVRNMKVTKYESNFVFIYIYITGLDICKINFGLTAEIKLPVSCSYEELSNYLCEKSIHLSEVVTKSDSKVDHDFL